MELHYVKTKYEVDFTDDLLFESKSDLEKFIKYNQKYEYVETIECENIEVFYEKYENFNRLISELQEQIDIHKIDFDGYMKSTEFYINYRDARYNEVELDVGNVAFGDIESCEPPLLFCGKKLYRGKLNRLYEDHKNLSFHDDGLKSLKNYKEDVVYFIGDSSSNVVKIGYSSNISTRLQSLQTGYPRKLEVFKVIDGNRGLEEKLHKRFAKYRLNGEWFELSEEILAFMA